MPISPFVTFCLTVFDSWGKVPSGLTYGHITDLGNYQQCIHIDYNISSPINNLETNIAGKYCQARIPINHIISNIDTTIQLNFSQIEFITDFPIGVGIGICIPKVCNSGKIASILTKALNGVKVSVNNCGTIDKPEFEAIDYVAACIFGLIGLLLVLSTSYDLCTQKIGIRNETFLSFSVIQNSHKLFSMSSNSNPNSIKCLDGIRSLSMIFVVYGHSVVWFYLIPLLNLRKAVEWNTTPFALFLKAGVISVDTFFFLSGLLVAWMRLKELQRHKGRINIVKMYLHRLFRFVPLIAVIILFTLSFLKYCGDGPNWPTLLNTQKYPCEKGWWRTLLFIQNYGNDLQNQVSSFLAYFTQSE